MSVLCLIGIEFIFRARDSTFSYDVRFSLRFRKTITISAVPMRRRLCVQNRLWLFISSSRNVFRNDTTLSQTEILSNPLNTARTSQDVIGRRQSNRLSTTNLTGNNIAFGKHDERSRRVRTYRFINHADQGSL